jgi:uncharacterized membrane protein
MLLGPVLDAPVIIQCHLAAAFVALVLGPVVIWGRVARRWHRWLGYCWLTSMGLLAGSGLFIPAQDLAILGPLGPIHVLSFLTFWGIARGVWCARQGLIRAHQQAMRALWFWALGVAGLFTLLPGRLMNALLLPDGPLPVLFALLVGLGVILFLARLTPRPFRSRHSGRARVFALEKDQSFD